MNRNTAFKIAVPNLNNKEFSDLLDTIKGEGCLNDIQPESQRYNVFWLEHVPKEIFKFSACFDWLKNNVKLWYNGENVTMHNYRTAVYVGQGEDMVLDHYNYLNWEEMTDVAPIQKTEEYG